MEIAKSSGAQPAAIMRSIRCVWAACIGVTVACSVEGLGFGPRVFDKIRRGLGFRALDLRTEYRGAPVKYLGALVEVFVVRVWGQYLC